MSKLSLDDFKRWMKSNSKTFQTEQLPNRLVGLKVESKVSVSKIYSKMTTEDLGSEEEIAEDFVKNGGKIADVDGKSLLIEVESGSFFINRCYIRRVS